LNPKSKECRFTALHATAGCLDAEAGEASEQAFKAEADLLLSVTALTRQGSLKLRREG